VVAIMWAAFWGAELICALRSAILHHEKLRPSRRRSDDGLPHKKQTRADGGYGILA
jgi:hypothetical protein